MFTGLIEKVAKIENFNLTSNGAIIQFEADFNDVKLGDSIAVNGVCLTITQIQGKILHADVMKETLKLTNLKNLKRGEYVNLERAMSVNGRFDGHIVSGHIDTIAKLEKIENDGFAKRMRFNCNSELIIKKGSIAINGISLTVTNVFDDGFEVSLIPTTIEHTNLKNIKIGDIVNIEYDILGKYVQKVLLNNQKPKLTLEYLKEQGF